MFKRIFSLAIVVSLFIACSKADDDDKPEEKITPKEVSFDTNQNSSLMFQDDEALEVMTSEARTYSIAQVIRIKPIDEKTFEVSNFAPFDIEDAVILATIEGTTQVQLFKIKKIRGHATQKMKYPFVDGTSLFLDNENKKVDLSKYKTTGISLDKITFDFTGENETILKLKKLKALKWTIKYHNYDPNNDPNNNWMPTTAKDIRRFSGLMLNMGIVFVSDKFKQAFLNEPIIGNDGKTELTLAEKEKVYNDILNHARFNCGKVDKVSGLGGGATLGYAEHILRDYISKDAGDITSHEIGHCVGFNHDSSMTYPKTINNVSTGISPVMSRINKEFFAGGLFIVNLQNYYKLSDFQ
ncbi:hypothetical protein RB619_13095 [Flavobacterium sp. LHD-80]|uniref:hypothetical protein n=1 Tax=Flavobacterium sp. LHD-80 TaxID=3071411 RepID=UPI0027E05D7F|nr:hypothetical protein [Flavobacterium sp. LHD-80]MDQ6471585.1 hypothetical protein [Flavobacterium sp. LHD-80]